MNTTSAAFARARRLLRDRQRGVQDRAGRDAGEDALGLQQLPGAAQRVVRADREPAGQHLGSYSSGTKPSSRLRSPYTSSP